MNKRDFSESVKECPTEENILGNKIFKTFLLKEDTDVCYYFHDATSFGKSAYKEVKK